MTAADSQNSTEANMQPLETGPRKLRLISPVGAEQAEYEWPLMISKRYNAANEIVETIRHVSLEFPMLQTAITKNVLVNVNTNSYESMKILCDKYNSTIKDALQMWKGTSLQVEPQTSPPLLQHIIQICYNSSVGDPNKLNKYEPFSPEVYGETSFDFVQQMIDEDRFKENDIFVDLGSGVGQIVMHVAAAVNCAKCIGIEKADLPSFYAEKMSKKFRFWMKWWGKKHAEFEIKKGDFFDPIFTYDIIDSTFIFVNNFAFGPEVDHKLKKIFENLRDGSRIVSSREFCSLNFRISPRSLNDIGAIMKVDIIKPVNQSVSWTGKPLSYYIHTIDRTELELFFLDKKKNEHDKKNGTRGKKRQSDDHSSSSSAEQSNDSVDKLPSKWTRRTWSDFTHNVDGKMNASSEMSDAEMLTGPVVKKKGTRGRPRKTPLQVVVVPEVTAPQLHSPQVMAPQENSAQVVALQENIPQVFDLTEKSESEENVPATRTGPVIRPRGRPKKNSTVPVATATKPVVKRNKGDLKSLAVLHQQTLMSIVESDKKVDAPEGCVEQKLCSAPNVDGPPCPVPRIEVLDKQLEENDRINSPILSPYLEHQSFGVNSFNEIMLFKSNRIDELLWNFRHQLVKFNEYIKSEEYEKSLLKQIEEEERMIEERKIQINKLNKDNYEKKYILANCFKQIGLENVDDLMMKLNKEDEVNARLKAELEEMKRRVTLKEIQQQHLSKQIMTTYKENLDQLVRYRQMPKPKLERVEDKLQTLKESPSESPNMNFHELKYKRYIQRESKSQKERNTDDPQTPEDSCANTNASDKIKIDLDRINTMIYRGMNEDDTESNAKANDNMTPVLNGHLSLSTDAKGVPSRRGRKAKMETIKTRKDRDVIVTTTSAGCPTTQVVHHKNNKEKSGNKEVSKTESLSNLKSLDESPKHFPLKLKINTKESKVKILGEPEELNGETTSIKRKLSEEDSTFTTVNKKKNEKGKCFESNVTSEPKVVLKLSTDNHGQYYSTTVEMGESESKGNEPSRPYQPQNTAANEAAQSMSSCDDLRETSSKWAMNAASQLSKSPSAPLGLPVAGYHSTTAESESYANHKASNSPSISCRSSSGESNSVIRKYKKRSSTRKQSSPQSLYHSEIFATALPSIQAPHLSTGNPFDYASALNNLININHHSSAANTTDESSKTSFFNGGNSCFATNSLAPNVAYNNNQMYHQMSNNYKPAETILPHKKSAKAAYYKDYYANLNQQKSQQTLEYQLSSCMLEKGAQMVQNGGFDYASSLNCRYDNQAANYMSNSALHHVTSNNFKSSF